MSSRKKKKASAWARWMSRTGRSHFSPEKLQVKLDAIMKARSRRKTYFIDSRTGRKILAGTPEARRILTASRRRWLAKKRRAGHVRTR